MSIPASKFQPGWAIKTPLGKLMISTVAQFQVEAWYRFRGHLGIESKRAAMIAGYRSVRVLIHEP